MAAEVERKMVHVRVEKNLLSYVDHLAVDMELNRGEAVEYLLWLALQYLKLRYTSDPNVRKQMERAISNHLESRLTLPERKLRAMAEAYGALAPHFPPPHFGIKEHRHGQAE